MIDSSHVRWYQAGEEHGYEWRGSQLFETDRMILVTFSPIAFIGIPKSVLGDDGAAGVSRLWEEATTIVSLPVSEG